MLKNKHKNKQTKQSVLGTLFVLGVSLIRQKQQSSKTRKQRTDQARGERAGKPKNKEDEEQSSKNVEEEQQVEERRERKKTTTRPGNKKQRKTRS